jgi:type VI protein secretion system component VasK
MMEFILSPWTFAGLVTSLIGGGVAMWMFFPTVAATLITSKAGRAVLLALLIIVGVLFVLMRVFAAGRAKEIARQKEQAFENLRDRVKTDDEVRSLPVDERKRRLEQWSRG